MKKFNKAVAVISAATLCFGAAALVACSDDSNGSGKVTGEQLPADVTWASAFDLGSVNSFTATYKQTVNVSNRTVSTTNGTYKADLQNKRLQMHTVEDGETEDGIIYKEGENYVEAEKQEDGKWYGRSSSESSYNIYLTRYTSEVTYLATKESLFTYKDGQYVCENRDVNDFPGRSGTVHVKRAEVAIKNGKVAYVKYDVDYNSYAVVQTYNISYNTTTISIPTVIMG